MYTKITVMMLCFAWSIFNVSGQKLVLENISYKNKLHAFWTGNPKYIKIRTGKKVQFQIHKNKDAEEATVDSFKNNNIYFGKKSYPFSNLRMMSFVLPRSYLKFISAPVILGAGLALAGSGTYLGGYAIATYLNKSPFLFKLIEVKHSYFIFRIIPGVLAATVVGIGANVLGFYVAGKGFKAFLTPFKRTVFEFGKGKQWQLAIIDESEKK